MNEGNHQVRIALAEDNPDARQALAAQLAALGHQVVCAVGDGAELLQRCFESPVDVVIVDLDMPIMDGLEAAEEIAKRGLPVILLSGHPDAQQVDLRHEPLVATLFKPASSEGLQKAIEQATQSKRAPKAV